MLSKDKAGAKRSRKAGTGAQAKVSPLGLQLPCHLVACRAFRSLFNILVQRARGAIEEDPDFDGSRIRLTAIADSTKTAVEAGEAVFVVVCVGSVLCMQWLCVRHLSCVCVWIPRF